MLHVAIGTQNITFLKRLTTCSNAKIRNVKSASWYQLETSACFLVINTFNMFSKQHEMIHKRQVMSNELAK